MNPQPRGRYNPHMGGCQNYGPFLGTLNIRRRIIIGIQKGTISLTTIHMCQKLNSSKGGCIEGYRGLKLKGGLIEATKGDTGSLDLGSCNPVL